jgi:hypothetical protein
MLDGDAGRGQPRGNPRRARGKDVREDGGDFVDIMAKVDERGDHFVQGHVRFVFEAVRDGRDVAERIERTSQASALNSCAIAAIALFAAFASSQPSIEGMATSFFKYVTTWSMTNVSVLLGSCEKLVMEASRVSFSLMGRPRTSATTLIGL